MEEFFLRNPKYIIIFACTYKFDSLLYLVDQGIDIDSCDTYHRTILTLSIIDKRDKDTTNLLSL